MNPVQFDASTVATDTIAYVSSTFTRAGIVEGPMLI
jgi:hypothetical protein